jgi:S-adenosyl-L-methionine hydrolase (adenosine-forming)
MIITLTTDFGTDRGYVGAMKGVIKSINPEVSIVDISHTITPHDILEGALTVAEAAPFFPRGTIHAVVVDPGVGSEREGIIVSTERQVYVGPNNGVFDLVLKHSVDCDAMRIIDSQYLLPRLSETFHGRDVFAPVAAFLSLGILPDELAEPISEITGLKLLQPIIAPDIIEGVVIAIDRFGNLISNISVEDIDRLPDGPPIIRLGDNRIDGLVSTYSEVEPGEPAAMIGSGGMLEIAVNRGRATETLGIGRGSQIVIEAYAGD